MITYGFSFGFSDAVTLDSEFVAKDGNGNELFKAVSTYLVLSSVGSVVYENSAGQLQYFPGGIEGYNPISARKVLTSASVNGVTRSTTATVVSWGGSILR